MWTCVLEERAPLRLKVCAVLTAHLLDFGHTAVARRSTWNVCDSMYDGFWLHCKTHGRTWIDKDLGAC